MLLLFSITATDNTRYADRHVRLGDLTDQYRLVQCPRTSNICFKELLLKSRSRNSSRPTNRTNDQKLFNVGGYCRCTRCRASKELCLDN